MARRGLSRRIDAVVRPGGGPFDWTPRVDRPVSRPAVALAFAVIAVVAGGLIAPPAPSGAAPHAYDARSTAESARLRVSDVDPRDLPELSAGQASPHRSDEYDSATNLVRATARQVFYRLAPQGGARFVGGSNGVVTDVAPDLQSLARTHADELALSGRPPTAAAATVDRATGNVYFGQSGSVPNNIHPTLRSRMPSPSLEPWAVGNCAEFNACNAALWAGASIDDLIYGTVRTATRAPFPSCANCRVTLQGAKEML